MSRDLHPWALRCAPPTGLVRPTRVDPSGDDGPTRGQARGRAWRRTTPGYFVPATVSNERPEQRILEQSMRLTPDGGVTGWAALRLHGATFFDGLRRDGLTPRPVPLAIGAQHIVRSLPGSVLLRDRLPPGERVVVQQIACVAPARATFDAMRKAPGVREAVVVADMALGGEVVGLSELRGYVESRPAWQGVQQVRDALVLVSCDSRSPAETRLRLVWVLDAALPAPMVNPPVWDRDGRLLGYPDLFDPDAGLVAEYDGADHRSAERHGRDVAREHGFRRTGLEYVTITGPDMRHPHVVVQRLRWAHARAPRLPEPARQWTLTPPPWWRHRLAG